MKTNEEAKVKYVIFILALILIGCSKSNEPEVAPDIQYENEELGSGEDLKLYNSKDIVWREDKFGPGKLIVEFDGRSDFALNIGGELGISIGGKNSKIVKVDSSTYKHYQVQFVLPKQESKLKIELLNDFYDEAKKLDRNVQIKNLKWTKI